MQKNNSFSMKKLIVIIGFAMIFSLSIATINARLVSACVSQNPPQTASGMGSSDKNWDECPMYRGDLARDGTTGTSLIITPTNGTGPVWNYTVASQPTSPVVSNGYLYVGTAFAGMYCLNATSGNLIWHDLGLGLPNYVTSSPAIAGGYVYVGGYVGSDGYVYCLNALTGAVVWAQDISSGNGGIYSSPAVYNGYVYVATETNSIVMLSDTTGAIVHTGVVFGSDSSPAIYGGDVYIGEEVKFGV